MEVGFTGTREGMTELQEKKFLEVIAKIENVTEFHHGDCIGSDEKAHDIVHSLNVVDEEKETKIFVHPPSYTKFRANCKGDIILKPDEYLDRNRDIVESCDTLIATPRDREELQSGTWSTVRWARQKDKDVIVIYPDGKIEEQ